MRFLVLALLFTFPAGFASGQAIFVTLTEEQREKLKERDPLELKVEELRLKGKTKEAVAVVEEILALERRILDETHHEVLNSIALLAELQMENGEFEASKKTRTDLITLLTKTLGKDHWRIIVAVRAKKDTETLEKLSAEQRDAYFQAKRENDAQRYAFIQQKKYAEAVVLVEKFQRIAKMVFGENHYTHAACLHSLAFVNTSQGQHAKAEPFYLESLRIHKEVWGEKHPYYAISLNSLAVCYIEQKQYAKAEPLLIAALKIWHPFISDFHVQYCNGLNNLAVVFRNQMRKVEADNLLLESRSLRMSAVGKNHPEYLICSDETATIFYNRFDFRTALRIFRDSLQIRKKTVGEKHPDYAKNLMKVAMVYQTTYRYAEAGAYIDEAIRIRKEVLGEKHADYAASLSSLAGLYMVLGQYANALPHALQALKINKEVLGEKHPAYATSLDHLAKLYTSQGKYAEAEEYCLESLRIRKDVLGKKHLDYARSLISLTELYRSQGQHAKAEPFQIESTQIVKETYGDKHPTYASGLVESAMIYTSLKQYAKAEPLLHEAVEIISESFGKKGRRYAYSLNRLAFFYESQGLSAKAEPLYRQSMTIIAEHLQALAESQSETEQKSHLGNCRHYLDDYLKLTGVEAVAQYEAVFRWQGVITARQTFSRLEGLSSPVVRSVIEELRDIARRMNNLVQNPPKEMTKDQLAYALVRLIRERNTLEKHLSSLSSSYAEYQKHLKLTPADLQKSLPKGTAMVNFIAYDDRISAFVVTATSIRHIVLKAGKDLDEEIAAFLGDLSLSRTRPVTNKDDVSTRLRKRIWEPLEEHLQGITRVLICPAGPLCRLPFATLPGKDPGKYLLEELSFVVVPVPQLLPGLLAVEAKKFGGAPSLLAVGDVDFGSDPAAELEPQAPLPFPVKITRSGSGLDWKPLPQTKGEVELIETLFRKLPNATVKKFFGSQASQAAIERELARHRFVHLATHGFFAEPKMIRQFRENQVIGDENDRVPSVPPGLLCGVVCAGANKPTIQANGILTASQIAELDLSKVELAVLSACETNLGETFDGEGVLGLQRAFQMAGARATITTMWAIPDRATAELMKRMYVNRLEKGLAAAEALREAQLWVLNNGDKVGAFDEPQRPGKRTPPKFWAAFTFAGDWR